MKTPDRPEIGSGSHMGLRYSFLPGVRQAAEAASYFCDVAAELVAAQAGVMEPRQFMVVKDHGSQLPLRTWSRGGVIGEALPDLVPWLRELLAARARFRQEAVDEEGLRGFLRGLLEKDHGTATFFIEVLNPAHAFTTDECNELSIGVVGGRLVMISARNFIGVELCNGLFGASISGYGSMQCEAQGNSGRVQVA